MKLPSSSSLLLATLAISSSSSALAAPAGERDTTMTSPTSNHHISAFLSSSNIRDLGSADIDIEQKASRTVERSEINLEARQEGINPASLKLLRTLPVIGSFAASLVEKPFPNGADSVEGMPDISPDDLKALQAAVAEVSPAVPSQGNQTTPGVPSAVQSVNGTAPTAMSNGDGLNTDSFASNGFSSTSAALPTKAASLLSGPSAAAAGGSTTMDGTTSTQTPSESASTPQSSSPMIPGNPPNSPVPPAAYVG